MSCSDAFETACTSKSQPDLLAQQPKKPSIPLSRPENPKLVEWNGPDDPEYPKNWPAGRKWLTYIPVSIFLLFSSMSSSTVAPALGAISEDLHIKSQTLEILVLSVFYLGMGVVPLFSAPLSEIYGRVTIIHCTNIFYIIFNTACGFAKGQNSLIAFRFLAGMGAAGPFDLGSGMAGDLFKHHERPKALATYTAAPLLGIMIGPLTGGFLVQYVNWRWCFYVVSIAAGAAQIVGLFLVRETYASVLLQSKCKKLRRLTNIQDLYTKHDDKSLLNVLRTNSIRPIKMLGTQPIVQVLSLYVAYLNGIVILMIATFPIVFTQIYGESISLGALNYISLTVGMLVGVALGAGPGQRVYEKLKAKNGGRDVPEYRLLVMCIAAVFVPIGLFWYGWSARRSVHWIMPDIGAAIFAGLAMMQLVCVQTYLIDVYTLYAASAMAAVLLLRNLLGFALPLVAPSLYRSIGFAWGNSLLAFIAIGFGIPAPLLLWRYGRQLREHSTYAQGDGEQSQGLIKASVHEESFSTSSEATAYQLPMLKVDTEEMSLTDAMDVFVSNLDSRLERGRM